MITLIQLQPGITLRCCQDSRFKQGLLSFQFLRPMQRQEAAANALLPAVLLRGSQEYPDLRAITLGLDALYGAGIGAAVRRVGDCQASGLSMTFLEDRFALPGEQVFAPMVDFFQSLLLHPLLQDGVFREDYVESEKRNLIAAMESRRNDKTVYAMDRLLQNMCRQDSYGIPRLGEPAQVREITPQSLTAHYQALLAESPVELLYVGACSPEQAAARLSPLAEALGSRSGQPPVQRPFQDAGGGQWQEAMEISQSRLCLAFATPVTLGHTLAVPMRLMNLVFGGGMMNKLFQNLREKMSLCYDISSAYHAGKGILTVTAGIDAQNAELARREILAQLEACCRGDISELELTGAKEAMCSSLRAAFDAPESMESYYFSAALSSMDMDVPEYTQAILAANIGQLSQAARTLRLHSEFLLKGEPK
ncbi:MAG TPA: insulinase family protein [Candidatus Faecousia intestinigallinarum]|nr:insulinase family protein [Candidatus Faecousia intestinigallinarum]